MLLVLSHRLIRAFHAQKGKTLHEIYLAEGIINKIVSEAQQNQAESVLEVRIAIPEDDHYTPESFVDILKMQAEGTLAETAKFYVAYEEIKEPYIKDIKIK